MKRSAMPNRVNKDRRDREFPRTYGSIERVQWVQRQPCIVPGCDRAPCVNMHVEGGGAGRKADADKIAPGCHVHHHELDTQGRQSFEAKYGIDLQAAAYATEQGWQFYLANGCDQSDDESLHAF
jgi:hypothetical protein